MYLRCFMLKEQFYVSHLIAFMSLFASKGCKVTCFGRTGHACHFVEGTAAEKLLKIMNKLMAFRDKERKR